MPFAPATKYPVIRHGSPNEKVVALTFDDGPHGANTLRLLRILQQKKQRATFFLVGKMAKRHPDLVSAITKCGHELGNHTFSHVTLTKVSAEEVRADYQACNDMIFAVTGKRAKVCRPPGGDSNPNVIKAGASLGMTTVLWTADPGDYYSPGAEKIYKRTMSHIHPGGIILLHDGISQTLDVLPRIIDEVRAKGYRLITAGELIQGTQSSLLVHQQEALLRTRVAKPRNALEHSLWVDQKSPVALSLPKGPSIVRQSK